MTVALNWKPLAQDRLAEVWMEASDRSAVTDAARTIEEALRQSPETAGEQRSGRRRIMLVTPLAVAFDVFPEDRRVDVLDVRRIA